MGRCSAHRLVDVMQPAENWHRLDRASDGTDGGPSRLQRQAPMWTFGAVVPNELGEHRPQMLLVKDDQVVEALGPQAGRVPNLPERLVHCQVESSRILNPGTPRRLGSCPAQTKMSKGRKAETTKFGTSTISLIFRSTATLHRA